MTTAIFILGVAAIVGGVAAWSPPLAAIVGGTALVVVAVLIERGRSSDPAAATPSTRNPKE